jgi:hypothetical protein
MILDGIGYTWDDDIKRELIIGNMLELHICTDVGGFVEGNFLFFKGSSSSSSDVEGSSCNNQSVVVYCDFIN